MADALVVLGILAFFAVCRGYVTLCDRLIAIEGDALGSDRGERP